jgi:predicted kinase
MSDKDFIGEVKKLVAINSSATDEEVSENAFNYIKQQKKHLPKKFLEYHFDAKQAIFMAGGSGVGKSETASKLADFLHMDVIDTDEIRKICPHYGGANASLFQKAASKGVAILFDYVLKHQIAFILDSNFAEYEIQVKNIERLLAKDYNIKIVFVYQDKALAKETTQKRASIEKRIVPDDIFEYKYINSILTTIKILEKYPNIKLELIDLVDEKRLEDDKAKEKLAEIREVYSTSHGEEVLKRLVSTEKQELL